jgi:geranylgeranylglycerol-phosphate geranylgeranyltransferase
MNKAIEILKLTRIEHSLLLVVAVLAAELMSGALPQVQLLLLSIITPIFISMGAFAINDYFDVKVDRLNKKMRPLVTGTLTRGEALYITEICMIVGIVASAFINWYCLVIAIIFAALAILYSYRLKEILFWGNAYIAASMVIPFVFGDYVVSTTLGLNIILVSAMIFFSGLAREIHGTIRDYSGDIRIRNAHTIPKEIGPKNSSYLAFALYIVAIIISVFIFLFVAPFRLNPVYGVLILVVDICLVYVSVLHLNTRSSRYYGLTRNLSLAAMGLALFAILLSSFL